MEELDVEVRADACAQLRRCNCGRRGRRAAGDEQGSRDDQSE
jgi:hypothetical protein